MLLSGKDVEGGGEREEPEGDPRNPGIFPRLTIVNLWSRTQALHGFEEEVLEIRWPLFEFCKGAIHLNNFP